MEGARGGSSSLRGEKGILLCLYYNQRYQEALSPSEQALYRHFWWVKIPDLGYTISLWLYT